MKLWLLERCEDCDYDEVNAMVVCAGTSKRARVLASEKHEQEGPEVWMVAKFTSCKELKPNKAGVVIRDMLNG